MIIINPGTEKQVNHNVENATEVAKIICKDLEIGEEHFERGEISKDSDGWYNFIFKGKGGKVEVDIPGIKPETVVKGEPWVSPRLYVNGSSWLYGYALGFIFNGIKKEEV